MGVSVLALLLLRALTAMLSRGQPFPYDYVRGWQDAVEHILADLRTEARMKRGGASVPT